VLWDQKYAFPLFSGGRTGLMHKQYVDGNKEGRGSKRNNKKTWIEWNNQTKEEWEINTLKCKQNKEKKQQDTKNIHSGINKEQQHTRGLIYKFSAIVFRNILTVTNCELSLKYFLFLDISQKLQSEQMSQSKKKRFDVI